jgi:hypothetical protein
MIFLVFSSLVLVSNFQVGTANSTRTICTGKNATSQYVIDYCEKQSGYLVHRCCRSSDNDTFIAVDLTDSDLEYTPDFAGTTNLNLSVIDLRSNPQLEPLPNASDFITLITLDTLILPDHFECPGGYRIWKNISKITEQPTGNLCSGQIDYCLNTTDACTEQASACSPNGPNQFLCLCKSGYHGYKCLRHGTFPNVAYFGTTAGVTVIVSALLYWSQRRHVKK